MARLQTGRRGLSRESAADRLKTLDHNELGLCSRSRCRDDLTIAPAGTSQARSVARTVVPGNPVSYRGLGTAGTITLRFASASAAFMSSAVRNRSVLPWHPLQLLF